MSYKKRKITSSSQKLDGISVENTIAAVAGSEGTGTPSGPTGHSNIRKAWRRRPRWLRRLLWVCAVMAALVVVLRIILWLSLPRIINKTMTQYGLETHYERLSLSLLTGNAELWHLILVPTGTRTPITDIEYCRAEISLITLLTSRLVVPRLEIDGVDVNLTRAEDGTFPQLETLLEVLRQRKIEAKQAAPSEAPIAKSPRRIGLLPALKMDALRLQHVQVRFQDKSVTPVFETQLDLNIRLSDLESDKRKTRFQVILSSPPVLDQLMIEGTNSSVERDILADVKVALQGLHPGTVKDYLADLGMIPDARNLALAWAGSVRIQEKQMADVNDIDSQGKQPPASGTMAASMLQIHLESQNTVLTIDDMEHVNLEYAAVDANLLGSGALRVGKIQARHGEFHAWKRATGAFSVAGFQFIGRPQQKPTAAPDAAGDTDAMDLENGKASGSVSKSPRAWSLDGVEVNDVRFTLHDESVSPGADLVLDLKEAAIAKTSLQSDEMILASRLSAPGVMDSLRVDGTMKLSSSESGAVLKLFGTGIRPDALQAYLKSLGLESLYKEGAFQCDVDARFAQQKDGAVEGSAAITNISMQDTDELFGLKGITVGGVKINPNSGTIHIEQVEISGQRLALGRDATGCLTALGFRYTGGPSHLREGQPGTSIQPNQPFAKSEDTIQNNKAAASKPMARIEIERISWHDNKLTFVDQMVKPAKTIVVPDLGFEMTNFILGAEGDTVSPASLKVWLNSPGTIERVELNGTMAPHLSGLSFELHLNSAGLALTGMSPYLQALGLESTMTRGSMDAGMNGQINWQNQGIRCSATVRDLTIKDGDMELAGFNQLDVAKFDLDGTGMRVGHITIQQPRLALSREKSDVFSCVGLRTVSGREIVSETPPVRMKLEPEKSRPALPVRVDCLEIKDAKIQWSDYAVVPSVSQAAEIDLTLTDFVVGVEAPPAAVALIVRAPGMIQQATVSGHVQTAPTKQGTDLKLEAAGINVGPLLSYLPKGCKPVLEDGKFNARILTDLTPHPEGGQCFRVNVADVDYRGDSQQEPLLRFDSAELAVDRFDPNAQLISIRQVSLEGLEFALERKASGAISLMGLDMGASASESGSNPSEADKTQDRASGRLQKAQRFPLITLEHLSLQANKLIIKDQTRSTAVPLVISDLQIANIEGIKVLGDEPDTNPPVRIDIHGRIQPLTESLALKLELSPFVAQPQILAEWDIAQIHGPGLTSVLPELQNTVDAGSLPSGRLSGSAQLILHMERRNVAEFDFGKPFGLDLSAKDVMFRQTETETALAGLGEFRAVIPMLDTTNNIVHVKEVSLTNLQGEISRQTDGLHMLGMTLKISGTGSIADANDIAAPLPGKGVNDVMAHQVEDSQKQGKELDLRVDQFLLNGIDFSFVDQTVDPPMYMPLKGLDVEVRGFTTLQAQEPVRFNVIATAGTVPLPGTKQDSESKADESIEESSRDSSGSSTMENRLLFQEMTVSGRMTLYPRPEGWVKGGLSGLELANFKGAASQKWMTLRQGIFDSSVDVRFHKEQPMSVRSRLVFTDLSLTEPPDGFLAKLLALPVSLDTVLFILSDADGSIQVPLSFKIGDNGLSRGQITGAALGAAASVIGSAVAGSPFRVAGTIGNIMGVQKEETDGAETLAIKYAAGVTTFSDEQARELAKIRERLKREKDIFASVRHNLGGGDIEKANGLVNLSSIETKELLARLRQNRSRLQQVRDELAGQTRVAFSSGSRENITAKTKSLWEIETQLGLIEEALDDLLETTRPGSEYAAKRRTRDACISIGKARLETLFAFLAEQEIPNGAERITFVPPRFTENSGTEGGSVTLTLSKNKAR